jgi:hypothetical protein
MLRSKLLLIAVAVSLVQVAKASGAVRKIPQPGVKEVQVPFQSLKPSATFKIGKTADWVLVTDDAVWVEGSKPHSVQRIDPSTNGVVAKIRLSVWHSDSGVSGFQSAARALRSHESM